jgi:hypothetical protein
MTYGTLVAVLRVVEGDEKGSLKSESSKIWSRVPDWRKTALARTSSIYKRQTHPLVREEIGRAHV